MASIIAREAGGPYADALLALIAADGAAGHGLLRAAHAFSGADGMRNLADAVHFLCMLHGRHPGLIDNASQVTACATSQAWLGEATPTFVAERAYLTRIAVAAGPVPSTPGSAESEAAVAGQYHALRMLGRSERRGCPLGAAVALAVDWRAWRPLLDHAAGRLGIDIPACRLPDRTSVAVVVGAVADEMPVRRALGFGVDQVLVQHRGLLDLLEARQIARREA